jgi:predicted nucleic acid-binding protein
MKDSFFLDSNIFIYCFDPSNRLKRERATDLVENALESGRGMISYQVVQEVLNVLLGKLATPLRPADAERFLNQVLFPLCRIFPSLDLYRSAITLRQKHRFSFYDALIAAAALEGKSAFIYSENFHHDLRIGSTLILNPFLS